MAIKDTIEILKKIEQCKSDLEMAAYHVEVNKDVFPLYMSSIETIISLSIAALILSVSFREKVLGQTGAVIIGKFLALSWLSFLSAIICGASYLFVAAKHFELRYICTSFQEHWGVPPSYIYTATLVMFVFGAIFLVLSVLRQTYRNVT